MNLPGGKFTVANLRCQFSHLSIYFRYFRVFRVSILGLAIPKNAHPARPTWVNDHG